MPIFDQQCLLVKWQQNISVNEIKTRMVIFDQSQNLRQTTVIFFWGPAWIRKQCVSIWVLQSFSSGWRTEENGVWDFPHSHLGTGYPSEDPCAGLAAAAKATVLKICASIQTTQFSNGESEALLFKGSTWPHPLSRNTWWAQGNVDGQLGANGRNSEDPQLRISLLLFSAVYYLESRIAFTLWQMEILPSGDSPTLFLSHFPSVEVSFTLLVRFRYFQVRRRLQ